MDHNEDRVIVKTRTYCWNDATYQPQGAPKNALLEIQTIFVPILFILTYYFLYIYHIVATYCRLELVYAFQVPTKEATYGFLFVILWISYLTQ